MQIASNHNQQLADALYAAAKILAQHLDIYWKAESEVIADGWRVMMKDNGAWLLSRPDGSESMGNFATAEAAVLALIEKVAGQRYRDLFVAKHGKVVAR